jgi:hypothetical protein
MTKSLKASAGLLLVFILAQSAFAGSQPAFFDFRAVDFNRSEMSPLQKKLLGAYLKKTGTSFGQWTSLPAIDATDNDTDGELAAFLGITKALTHLQIHLEDGRWIVADQLLKTVNEFKGDRLMVQLDTKTFDSWRDAGAEFILTRASGEIENGSFDFDHGDFGGSLHEGSTIQGYTSYFLAPRIQINYNEDTHEADIDLDGYAPWIDGVIPNPHHMTWENSDIRYWFDEYQQSFGNPGFQVIAN